MLGMMTNPYKMAVQKYLFDILQSKYPNHQPAIERIAHYLVTEQDVRQFSSLIADVYQMAYLKAINDYRAKLANAGVNTNPFLDVEEFKS